MKRLRLALAGCALLAAVLIAGGRLSADQRFLDDDPAWIKLPPTATPVHSPSAPGTGYIPLPATTPSGWPGWYPTPVTKKSEPSTSFLPMVMRFTPQENEPDRPIEVTVSEPAVADVCPDQAGTKTCEAIFSADTTGFVPGAPDKVNAVTLTYHSPQPARMVGLYAANFVARDAASNRHCTASDPAVKINLQILQGTEIVYPASGVGYGTLAQFAKDYGPGKAWLPLRSLRSFGLGTWLTNDSTRLTFRANLDRSADNTYQGCISRSDFVWVAQ